jgi:hypothetical protein
MKLRPQWFTNSHLLVLSFANDTYSSRYTSTKNGVVPASKLLK